MFPRDPIMEDCSKAPFSHLKEWYSNNDQLCSLTIDLVIGKLHQYADKYLLNQRSFWYLCRWKYGCFVICLLLLELYFEKGLLKIYMETNFEFSKLSFFFDLGLG